LYSANKFLLFDDLLMATTLSEVSSPLALGLWQLDQIRDLFERGSSIEDIAAQLNLDPILVHEVLEIRYQKYNKAEDKS
jgi:hypothetical protein